MLFLRPSRPAWAAVVALAALTAFTTWSFASVAWSDVRGDAWAGSNRTLLYLVVFALFLLVPLPRGAPVLLLGLYGTGVAFVGIATLVRVARASEPASFFIDGRLAEPAGYPNATAALFLAAYWPLLALATRRELAPWLRGTCLGSAVVLLGGAALAQSRASLIATTLVALLYLVVVPGRARALVGMALTGGAIAAVAPVLMDVYPALESGGESGQARRAALAVAGAAAATAFAAWALATLDARIDVSASLARRARVGVGATSALAAVVGVVWALVALGAPVERAGDAWAEFKRGQPPPAGASHLGAGLGSNRYDFWRVALGRFADRPLTGIGADNFAVDYVRERRSDEEPLYPHSLELRILAGTGLTGAILFGGFAVSGALAARRPRDGELDRAIVLAGLVASAYWLVHGSVDWFWAFPGLTLPAIAWLGLAANRGAPARPQALQGAVRLGFAAAVLVVGILFAAGWLAARASAVASSSWGADPAAAFARLERARALDPFSDRPDLLAGVIASRTDDRARMRSAFSRALERNPHGWFARLELALVEAETGNRRVALRHIRRARDLNPLDPVLLRVERMLVAGERPSREQVERELAERVAMRTR